MSKQMSDARRSLERAKESAQARLQDLDNERREIKASLKSLDAALKALDKSNRKSTTARQSVIRDESSKEMSDDVS
jgi:prefoldin subunit 5